MIQVNLFDILTVTTVFVLKLMCKSEWNIVMVFDSEVISRPSRIGEIKTCYLFELMWCAVFTQP